MKIGIDRTPFVGVTDPWKDYSSRKKGPSHPVVPEPGSYGLAMVALCLLVLGLRRFARSRVG